MHARPHRGLAKLNTIEISDAKSEPHGLCALQEAELHSQAGVLEAVVTVGRWGTTLSYLVSANAICNSAKCNLVSLLYQDSLLWGTSGI